MSSWQCASQKIPISCSITNDRGTKFFDHGAIAIPELTFESNKQEFDLQDFEGSSVLRCGYRNKISGHWSAGTSFYKLGDLLESHHAYKDCFFLHTSKNADLESLDDIIQVVHSFKPVSKGSNEETKPDIVLIYPESPEPLLSFPKRKPQNPASTAGSRNKHTLPKDSRTKDKSSEGNDDTGDTEALPEEKTFLQRFGLYLIPILFLLFVGTSGGSQASGSSNR
ncbi:peroxisomal membrane protein Pex22 [Schizosaccharomyces cryophilus OY26]|uniref:Peroxisomal membrane protein Pex22 n=1 Tax=Schizosaccharomyces cryophilus (strain OY26 / ATCC MYA-4695 / CBS 11777 / NBRC 106824 / NRRL Y48691) TaxID=653667 RepID=S9X8Q1_SCHCR|nr:peroxisomal membrane protein Pex22 [Schizosaccharomyces cryophilus OY26]EPY50206.1 peroxisomal membrane protein Pex22 [Schizosaccharomyces cryophilus OY26]